MGSVEPEEIGESVSRMFFDHGQCRRNFVCVNVGIESSEDQFGREAGGIG